MSLRVNLEVKRLFFDRGRVIRQVSRARRRALSRVGGYTMTTARRSMRSRKGSSRPGQPPHAHAKLLKRLLFFSYDEQRDSVVIGPVGFKGSEVPHVLEYGGTTRIKDRKGNKRKVRIAPRPFINPAGEKTREKLPGAFADAMRR